MILEHWDGRQEIVRQFVVDTGNGYLIGPFETVREAYAVFDQTHVSSFAIRTVEHLRPKAQY